MKYVNIYADFSGKEPDWDAVTEALASLGLEHIEITSDEEQ